MSNLGIGAGVASGARFTNTRGRLQGSMPLAYPSPFFDIAQTYLPVTVKHLFRWCRYYFFTNGFVNATIFKMAEYPITDILFDHENADIADKMTEYAQEHLHIRKLQLEIGLDYNVYGNALISIGYPFKKYLTCTYCKFTEQASRLRANYKFFSNAFQLTCPKCGNSSEAKVDDFFIRNPSGIKIIRWNPEDIEITYNDLTGEYTYFYTIPNNIKNDISLGKKDILEGIPQVFLSALKEQKGILLSKDNIYHLRRSSLATQDRGWGTPILLAVLKDLFQIQIMKKAEESILMEHAMPLRILFPQAGSGSSDPFVSVNLVDWREHVAREIAHFRMDYNYMPIMPLPLGNQTIGGDARMLLFTAEYQQRCEHLLQCMGVPREFMMGGLSWAGTNVSLKMLENTFIGYNLSSLGMVRWAVRNICNFLHWPTGLKVRAKPFKMADDLQRKAYRFQLNSAQKISDTTLLADDDFNQVEEVNLMEQERRQKAALMDKQQLEMAATQGKQQVVMAKYQAKAQQVQMQAQQAPQAPGEPGGPETMGGGSPGGQGAEQPAQMPQASMQSPLTEEARMPMQEDGSQSIQVVAQAQAQQLATLPPQQLPQALAAIRAQQPELYQAIIQILAQMGVKIKPQAVQPQQAPAFAGVDMRPAPDKLPPRRAGG